MSKRKVTLKVTTQKDLIHHESSARTLGELQKELPNVNWSGMRIVERSSKNTLQMKDALLPATDFLLFLIPEKMKSGADVNVATAQYNELRSYMAKLNHEEDAGLSLDGKVEELRGRLTDYLAAEPISNYVPEQDPVNIIEECRARINNAIDNIIAAAKVKAIQEDYVFKTSLKDLDTEISEIKKSLSL